MDQVAVVERVLATIPQPYRALAIKHRELVKFAVVGGTTWVIDTAVFLALKSTVLEPKPLTAKVIAVLVATIVSYVLNREWSFRTRGGRERHHEAALFFVISGVGVAVYSAPLAMSRYVFDLAVPNVSLFTQEMADFKLQPLEDRIVVQANEGDQTTASGLVIPDTAKEKPQEGTVVAAGPGRWNEDGDGRVALDVQVGDVVIYSKYGGTEVKVDGEEYLILSARDVLATLKK